MIIAMLELETSKKLSYNSFFLENLTYAQEVLAFYAFTYVPNTLIIHYTIIIERKNEIYET